MFDHLGIGVTDYARSTAFYDKALAPLGMKQLFKVPVEHTGGVDAVGYGATRPVFWLANSDPTRGHLHVAFAAKDRATVDAFHAAAIAAGGTDNGAPGVRPHYHPDYYGAFVLDPDGNNIEAVCHAPA